MSQHYTVIDKIKIQEIPEAKTLNMAFYQGMPFAVSKDFNENDLYVIFLPDGQLSQEYAEANDCVQRMDENGKRAGGFFAKNRKVRAVKFMQGKIRSLGYIAELDSLAYTGADLSKLEAGTYLSELNGVPVSNKFINEKTKAAQGNQPKKKKRELIGFDEHKDTNQFYNNYMNIFPGDVVTVTEKLDGTSVRAGYVYERIDLKWYHKLINKFIPVKTLKPVFVTGSRRVVLKDREGKILNWDKAHISTKKILVETFEPNIRDTELFREIFSLENTDTKKYTLKFIDNHLPGFKEWFNATGNKLTGYYGNDDIYNESTAFLEGRLPLGESFYGEIVGWQHENRPLFKRGGVIFKYGTQPGERRLFIYHIKRTLPEGADIHLPWFAVKERAQEVGAVTVPELMPSFIATEEFCQPDNLKAFFEQVTELAKGPSTLDPEHIREGVVVRIDRGTNTIFYKAKSEEFYALEDAFKNDENNVDIEEAA